jgi:hypothetical protein
MLTEPYQFRSELGNRIILMKLYCFQSLVLKVGGTQNYTFNTVYVLGRTVAEVSYEKKWYTRLIVEISKRREQK